MIATVVTAVLALGAVALTPRVAEAAPGDANATGVTIALSAGVSIPTVLTLPLVGLTAVVGSASAPSGGGTSQTGLLDAALSGLGVGTTGSVTNVSATRTAAGSSATSQIAGIDVGVLGISAVSTGVVSAQAVCPAGAPATATATVADLSLLDQAVTLSAASPTIEVGAAVSIAGLVGSTLHATARRIVSTTATTSSAVAVLVDLRLTASVPIVGTAVDLDLGSIQLAQASCQAPTATTTAMAPSAGPTSGGTTVTVTGNGLQNTTGVTFGGLAATSFTLDPAGTSLTAVSPASETAGGVAVVLARPTGDLTAGTFTYAAPTITAVDPPQGTSDGGTTVTVTGAGLAGATAVVVGGTTVAVTGTPTATSVAFTTPAHAAGAVDVAVTLPGADATAVGAYTFVQPTAPTITSFTPVQGSAAGNTSVTLTGTNLATVSGITFGGVPGTVVSQDATSLTATTPAHAPGPVEVALTGPGGTTAATAPFTFLDDGSGATFDAVAPATVPTSGGSTVTVTGTGLAGVTGLTVGGVPVTALAVSDTAVTGTVAASDTAGSTSVVLQFAAGTRTPGTVTYVAPSISGIAPASGPAAGSTVVTVTGTGLLPTTAVVFGGQPAAVTAATPDGTGLTVTTPAHAPGTVGVVAELPGADATSAVAFTYLDDGSGATIASSTPAISPTSGGGTVTVTGTGLAGATGLTVGGVAVTGLTIAPDGTSVSGTIPPAEAAGAASVVVTFPAGSVTADPLTYVAPTITGIDPSQGPTTGGTEIVILGSGFTGATGVAFGGTLADEVTVVDDTQIAVTTPAHGAGAVDVVVTLPGADATSASGFAFVPPGAAEVSAVSPSSGPVVGGTPVTVTGTGLGSATEVSFDGVPGTSLTVVSATTATVVTPPHAVGPVSVTITNAGGDSVLPDGYTYLADGSGVSVSTVSPGTVPTAGGSTITLTGTGLTGADGLTIGGLPATGVTVSADGSTLTAATPASESTGTLDIVVQFPLGTAPGGVLTYVGPDVPELSPTTGPASGASTVTLTGDGLEAATSVTFDGIPATGLTSAGPGVITVVTPAHDVGPVAVRVVLPGLDPEPVSYTYLADGTGATVSGISPSTLPTSGGTVTVAGTGLDTAIGLTIGGVPVTDLTVTAGSITATVPPTEVAGDLTVVVVFPAGVHEAGTLTLIAATLDAVSPTFGTSSGGAAATLTGTGLAAATAVDFGGVPAAIQSVDPAGTAIVVTVPAHIPGTVDVVVTLPGADAALSDAYDYLDDGTGASVTGLSPLTVPTTGGTAVTVTGAGLGAVTAVTVGGILAPSVTVAADGTAVTVVVPPAEAAGSASVTLWFPAGVLVADSVTYLAPTLTSLDPVTGAASGSDPVTLTGTGFSGVTQVTFGGVPATVVSVLPDGTEILLDTPAHLPGTVDVTVEQTGADATLVAAFTYLDDGTGATVDTLSPTTSPTAGGVTLTITGTGLAGATGVSVGGVSVPPTSVTTTSVTLVAPASESSGAVPVVLQFPAGQVPAGDLTYEAPVVESVAPATGPELGGVTVTLTGSGLDTVTAVTFGGLAGTGLTVTPGGLTVIAPAHGSGLVDVVVTLVGADAVLPDAYAYVALDGPSITSISPASGPAEGGTTVTITGSGLDTATAVTLGGTPATIVESPTASEVVVETSAHPAGSVAVVVTTASGTVALPDAFAYLAGTSASTLSLAWLAPQAGPTAGGQSVTIAGTGFVAGATSVSLGGTPVLSVTVLSDTALVVLTPPGAAGVRLMTVTVEGLDPQTLLYEYQAPVLTAQAPLTPTVTTTAPAVLPSAGGVLVEVSGTGFVPGGTTVVVCGAALDPAQVTVAADGTRLTFVAPECEPGRTQLLLTTVGGTVVALVTYVASDAVATTVLRGGAAGASVPGTSVPGDSVPGLGALARTGPDAAPEAAWWALALLVGGAGLLALHVAVRRPRAAREGAVARR